jgi:hypothetical protein
VAITPVKSPDPMKTEYPIKKSDLRCYIENIRQGLVVKYLELRNILIKHKIDIVFLTKTDTKALEKEDKYVIAGYKAVFQERKSL